MVSDSFEGHALAASIHYCKALIFCEFHRTVGALAQIRGCEYH